MKISGQSPFEFVYRDDLHTLPNKALDYEVDLHGGFAVNHEPSGGIYYGMPGCGIIRISDDLMSQEIIELPDGLNSVNFHGTKICTFDNKRRLVLPANNDEKIIVLSLEGEVDFVLSRPEFEEYNDESVPFKPTDTAITDASSKRENLMPFIIDAAKKYATLGEIVDSMKVVFGEWNESSII